MRHFVAGQFAFFAFVLSKIVSSQSEVPLNETSALTVEAAQIGPNLTAASDPWTATIDRFRFIFSDYTDPAISYLDWITFNHQLYYHWYETSIRVPGTRRDTKWPRPDVDFGMRIGTRSTLSVLLTPVIPQTPTAPFQFTVGFVSEMVAALHMWGTQWGPFESIPFTFIKVELRNRRVVARGSISGGRSPQDVA